MHVCDDLLTIPSHGAQLRKLKLIEIAMVKVDISKVLQIWYAVTSLTNKIQTIMKIKKIKVVAVVK